MQNSRKKVFIVCMVDSIHTARWLKQFKNSNIDFHIFPSTPNRKIHKDIVELANSKSEQTANYKIYFGSHLIPVLLWGADLLFKNRIRGFLVSRVLKKIKPDFVHAMELNHAGYLLASAFDFNTHEEFKTIATVWGSDIYWFRQFPKHRKLLTGALTKIELLISECVRDKQMASELGFSGEFFLSPSLFGFEQFELENKQIEPSKRKIILVKGYESFVGRASLALKAIENLSSNLENYEIHIYSSNRKTVKIAKALRYSQQLNIFAYKKKSLSNAQLLNLYRKARIHLGISLSDGAPASLLESMATGAFPIQTNTACAEQWVVDKESALLVNPELSDIERALMLAITDDELVDNAARINERVAKTRLRSEDIYKKLATVYC